MVHRVTDHHPHAFFLHLLTIIQFLALVINIVIAGPNGLTMKLIHRDSIESPLYPGNLTYDERIQRQADQSKARLRYLTANRIDPDAVSLTTIFEGLYYIALVGIGDFPSKSPSFQNYYFVIDSGSDLVWTQCEGANPSFQQTAPLFPYTQSSTYRRVPCDMAMDPPPCRKEMCVNGLCNYDAAYGSGSVTTGALATERFTLTTEIGALERVNNVVFGCGFSQKNFHPFERPGMVNEIAGILGISGGATSFLTQLGDRGQGKFSYCFQPWTAGIAISTYLRFGDDAKIVGGGVQTIPIAVIQIHYYVDLDDMSLDNQRLNIPERWLKLYRGRETGRFRGGCIIDSGAPYTTLHERVFFYLEKAVRDYYSRFHMSPMPHTQDPRFKLCYEKPSGFDNYPTLKFHFHRGAVYTLNRDNAFYVTNNKFCLAFASAVDPFFNALIGAWQMTNHRFLYDIADLKLSFVEEDCHMDA